MKTTMCTSQFVGWLAGWAGTEGARAGSCQVGGATFARPWLYTGTKQAVGAPQRLGILEDGVHGEGQGEAGGV